MNKYLITLLTIIALPIQANEINYTLHIKNANTKHPINLHLQDAPCLIGRSSPIESSFSLDPLHQKVIKLKTDSSKPDCLNSGKAILYKVSMNDSLKSENTFSAFIDIPKDGKLKYDTGIVANYKVNFIQSAKCSFDHQRYHNCYYKSSKSKLMTTKHKPKLITTFVQLNVK